jgi:glycosyltransferase involved in cell wall biosynthesis
LIRIEPRLHRVFSDGGESLYAMASTALAPGIDEPLERPRPADVSAPRSPKIAVLIPCFNEEATVAKVVRDFRRELPGAEIHVFNNRSQDATARVASENGAVVTHVPRKGKGFAVADMFRCVRADAYVMVDGDDTYPADRVHDLLAPLFEGRADMVVGTRLQKHAEKSFRPLHVAGNRLVRDLVNWIFKARLTDILSGYRAFGRRLFDGLPIVSSGFEVETEMTVNALYYRYEIVEVPILYGERPEGSVSKLRTFHDGARVLWKLFSLFRAFKPLTFFGAAAAVLFLVGLVAGYGPIADYAATGEVARFPRAILATGLVLLSAGCAFMGVLLHAFNWRLLEIHNLLARAR